MGSVASEPALQTAPRAVVNLSVIIPTKDRPADLARTVASLLGQTVAPAELIIVDQSRGGESRSRIRALPGTSPGTAPNPSALRGELGTPGLPRTPREWLVAAAGAVTLKYLHCPELPGLAAARNRGMEHAQAEIWLFLDDDVVLEPDFLAALLAAHQAHPEATGIAGIVTNYARPGRLFRAWRGLFAHGPFHDPRQAIYWNADRLRGALPRRVRRLGGGLMSFRAAALHGLRFDEQLAGVSDGEDVDFCARLGPQAILLMAPAARLAHLRSPAGREPIHWLQRQARSESYLYYRDWRAPGWPGLGRRLCFFWLLTGYGLAAGAAGLRRRSREPWHAWRAGLAEARAIAAGPAPPPRATARARHGWPAC